MNNNKHCDGKPIRKWYHPEVSLEKIGLRSGMTFIDIGCGYGFFTIPAAQKVGEAGKVYAVDINASYIDKLMMEATKKGLKNIHAEVGAAEEIIFCKHCADIIFYSIVLHDFRDPAMVLDNAKRMIKPDGTLVNVDWKKKHMRIGPPLQIRFSKDQTTKFIKEAGFIIESVKNLGSKFYIVKARPKKDG